MILSLIGNVSLVLNLIFCFKFLLDFKDDSVKQIKFVNKNFLLISLSLFSLIIGFALNDNNLKIVSLHSHSMIPLIYKISGSWANHEGSMLLFCWIINLYNMISFKKIRETNFLISQIIISVGIIIYILLVSNPFELNLHKNLAFGLNPILQDPLLAIHPPILYFGYAGFSVTFSYSLAILLKENYEKNDWLIIKYWANISWGFLSFGIMLGSLWAYKELGWGGFWFWDPVENSSLIPWLISLSLIHSVYMTAKNSSLAYWTIFLSLINFISAISGIFLVRSGLLSSVHSFAYDSERGIFILIYMILLIIYATVIFLKKIKSVKHKEKKSVQVIQPEEAILLNNIFFLTCAITIFIGTIFPLIYEYFSGQVINIAAPYYNKTILPLFIISCFSLNFISYFRGKKIKFSLYIIFLLSSIISYFFYKNNILTIIELSGLFVGLSLTINMLIEFFERWKNKILSLYFLRVFIPHFAFGLIIIIISLNSNYSKEINLNMKEKDIIYFVNLKIKLEKISYTQNKNYFSKQAKFLIIDEKSGNELAYLFPEIRSYPVEKSQTNETSIYHSLLYDLLIMIGQNPDNEIIKVIIYYRPLMAFLWLGVSLIICSSVIIYILSKKEKNKVIK